MKNLKFNKDGLKKLISTGMVLITLSNLTGCSFKSEKEEQKTDSKKLETIVSNKKMINVADLRIKDTENDKIVENIDAVLIDNKLEKEFDIIDVMFNSSIETVQIGDELVPVSRLKLVDVKNNEELDVIDYAVVGNELIEMKSYFGNTTTDETTKIVCEHICDECAAKLEEDVYVDKDLTDEEFYELVDEIYEDYSEIGLDVKKEEVTDYIMMVNIDEIAEDNKELIPEIIGDRKVENFELNAFDVYSAVQTENNYNWCSKGLGWDSLILVSDTVFDDNERKVVENIENRVKEIVECSNNVKEFNKLLNTLLMEMLKATEEEFNMDNGAGYSVMNIIMNFVRINFKSILDDANSNLIKYFISYAEEYGTTYYENSRSTSYYGGIYNLVTENANCKVKTK